MERSDERKRYNGWENYETWTVSLWLDNEEPSYRYWREVAAECRHEVSDSTRVCNGDCTRDEAARDELAFRLMQEIRAAAPLTEAGMYASLLRAALDEVNWHEIAENWLKE